MKPRYQAIHLPPGRPKERNEAWRVMEILGSMEAWGKDDPRTDRIFTLLGHGGELNEDRLLDPTHAPRLEVQDLELLADAHDEIVRADPALREEMEFIPRILARATEPRDLPSSSSDEAQPGNMRQRKRRGKQPSWAAGVADDVLGGEAPPAPDKEVTPPDPQVRQPAERSNPTGQETPQTNLKTKKDAEEAWDWGRFAGDALPWLAAAGGGAVGGAALMHLLSRPAVAAPAIAQPGAENY